MNFRGQLTGLVGYTPLRQSAPAPLLKPDQLFVRPVVPAQPLRQDSFNLVSGMLQRSGQMPSSPIQVNQPAPNSFPATANSSTIAQVPVAGLVQTPSLPVKVPIPQPRPANPGNIRPQPRPNEPASLRPQPRPANLQPPAAIAPSAPVAGSKPSSFPRSSENPNLVVTPYKDKDGDRIQLTPAAAAGLDKIMKMAEQRGIKVRVNSSYRSVKEQTTLWNQALKKYGSESKARKWVAPPGKSRHNFGQAIDMNLLRNGRKIPQKEYDQIIAQAGMHRPMSWETWHIEPIGSRSTIHMHEENESDLA